MKKPGAWRRRVGGMGQVVQIAEYGRGARKRAVFFEVLFAYFGSSFILIQRGSGPNFFHAPRWLERSEPLVK